MPTTSATTTSRRLLSLLSLLQVTREWPGWQLAERLDVSERTVRRDVERLRDLGYEIRAAKGPDGGYRLDAGAVTPPMLFDDDQVVAIAIALHTASGTGADIGEPAARALATVRQVLPSRLRARIDSVELTPVPPHSVQVDTNVLLAIGAAIRAREELRFDYRTAGEPTDADPRPPLRVHPHHLVSRSGRWYLIAWTPDRDDWRIYRADRITPRIPNGPRFIPHELPGADVSAFLSARFKGSASTDIWPCEGDVVLHAPATEVIPYAGDGLVEPLADNRCRLRLGAWSWAALAASLSRFDADIDVLGPTELRQAFAQLSRRAARAAGPWPSET
ncbi:helix-turn-helix transcriptional regulator [Nocardia jejuensis]|uniref:helix-turn-helix transcriptional regulator n=1 Tax=Nocardia jejuensis TaxID=328049 RepID=UPI000836CA11|nr:WYL domain-containing protein [Nocardia jejuensis]